jgi:drug/metabolite transporter (DMT)-like permease
MIERIRKFENLHILFWLIKVGMAVYITWLSRSVRKELFHNLAVCGWIMANSIWMLGEFFMEDGTRPIATVFFLLGLGFIAYYYVVPTKHAS